MSYKSYKNYAECFFFPFNTVHYEKVLADTTFTS